MSADTELGAIEHVESGDDVLFDMTVLPNSETPYGVLVKDLCEELFGIHGDVLRSYWDAGSLLMTYVNEQIADGDARNIKKALESVSVDMHAVTGGKLDYSDSTLRNMLKFREKIEEEQLHRMQRLGIPIRKALAMCVSDVTPEDRTTIIEELETGAIDSANVPERVRELHPAPERDPSKPARGPFQAAGELEKSLSKMHGLIERDLTLGAVQVFSSPDSSDAVDMTQRLRKLDNLVDTLNRLWETLYHLYVTDSGAADD